MGGKLAHVGSYRIFPLDAVAANDRKHGVCGTRIGLRPSCSREVVMTEPVGVALCEEPATRSEFVTAIGNRWHRIYRDTLAIADLLFIAKKKLDVLEFKTMVSEELPFGMDTAYRIMRIAADPKIASVDHGQLPRDRQTLDILRRLPDNDFMDGVRYGKINAGMTRDEAQAYLEYSKAHRPNAIADRPATSAELLAPGPHDGLATTWSQFMWSNKMLRQKQGLSQADIDKKVNWAPSLMSKLEIPHMPDGRFANPRTYDDMLQAIDYGTLSVLRSVWRGLTPQQKATVVSILQL